MQKNRNCNEKENVAGMKTSTRQNDIKIVKYNELEPCFDAFIDTRTPGSDKKENFTIIGPGVSENPNQHVHIMEPHGFNIGAARQPPACVNSQHSHDTAEFFYVHSGTWSFVLGEDGKDASVTLNAGDAISIPTHIFRGFENIGQDMGFLWAVLGGDDPGRVLWAPAVFDMAEEYGLILLENGSLIDTHKGERVSDTVKPMAKTTAAQVAQLQTLSAQDLRNSCVTSSDPVPMDKKSNSMMRKIVGPDGQLNWPHEFSVNEIRLAAQDSIALGKSATHQVLFGHIGSAEIVTDSDSVMLEQGDTATIARNTHRTLYNHSHSDAIIVVVDAILK